MSISYTIQSATFTRVGLMTLARGLIRFVPTFTTASGAVTIAGLPGVNSSIATPGTVWVSGSSFTAHILMYVNAGASTMTLLKSNSSAVTVADILVSGASRDLYFTAVYVGV
jgi:hypothetical protein